MDNFEKLLHELGKEQRELELFTESILLEPAKHGTITDLDIPVDANLKPSPLSRNS